ncbi:MAG: tetratricopeptide repeat protein [Candidatus Latescibacteria bacterium]|nr:tetratricopeptide repeat protein [Candidatus Latescibacterota bacterium]
MRLPSLLYAILPALVILPGCAEDPPPELPSAPLSASVRFTDVTTAAGIDFVHTSGRSGRKYGIETIGSGAVFFDYDNDGYIDLYLVNGGDLPGHVSTTSPRNTLYHNEGDGTFAATAHRQGLADSSYGMGASAGDYDNDGNADLFVANFGVNALYRNGGEDAAWQFSEIGATTIIAQDTSWSTGSAFVDYDLDGDLDLYVANYLDYGFEADLVDPSGGLKRPRRHLAPTEYPGRRDFLYRNEGDDRFTDVTAAAGLLNTACRELGAVFFDFDEDGDPDLFQGNDATPNFLYRNQGDGTFAEMGLLAGVAYNEAGKPEGTMGVDIGDIDGDGLQDLVMTNFQWESNTLYRNLGDGLFRDESMQRNIGADSFARLAFGINLFDADNDSDLDLYVANGHIDEDIDAFDPQATYAQVDHFYLNDGHGRFDEITPQIGPDFARPGVGRGSAVADYDNDGDLDLIVLNTHQAAVLLRNDTPPRNNWIALDLEGTHSNRDGFGARLAVVAGKRVLRAHSRSSSSYLSQSDPRLFFGLGDHDQADRIEIDWPSGQHQELGPTQANQVVHIVEPRQQKAPTVRSDRTDKIETEIAANLAQFWEMAPAVLPQTILTPVAVPTQADLDSLQAATRAVPDSPNLQVELGDALRPLRRYSEAADHYDQALKLDPAYAPAYTALGQLRSAQGNYDQAVTAFKRAAELDPTAAQPHYFLGNTALRRNRLEAAAAHYEQALNRDPTYLQAYINLSGLHTRQTDYGPAVEVFERGLSHLPGHPELTFLLARLLFVQTHYQAALERLEEVARLEPESSRSWELAAQAHLQMGASQQALTALNQGLARDSTNAALRARLGVALLEDGQTDRAISHLDFAVRADPDHAEAYYNLGQARNRRGQTAQGAELLQYFQRLQDNYQSLLDYKTAISINPDDPEAYYDLGAVYSRMGRWEAARQMYAVCLRLAPQHLDALNNLGNIYLRRRQLNQAIAAYQQVLAGDSTYARACNNLGNAYLLTGRQREAIEVLERAVRLQPDYASPHRTLARIYRHQGLQDRADSHLRVLRQLQQAP